MIWIVVYCICMLIMAAIQLEQNYDIGETVTKKEVVVVGIKVLFWPVFLLKWVFHPLAQDIRKYTRR